MRSFFAITLAALAGIQSIFCNPKELWEELTPMPEGRAGMIAFPTESEPAYFGGTSWADGVKQTHASGYRLHSGEWLPLDSLIAPIAYAAVTSNGTQVYAAGGTDGISLRSTLLRFSSYLQIQQTEVIASQSRIYAGAAFINNVLYQIGGSTELAPLNPSSSICKFENDSWSEVGQLPEGALINPAVVSWKGELLVIGGGIPIAGGLKNTDSVYSFDPEDKSWTKQISLPAPTRGAAAITVPDFGVLVIGGYLDPPGFSNQVLLYDPAKNQLDSLPGLPTGLMLPAVVASGKWIYVFGGEDAAKHRSSHVWRAGLSELIQSRGE